MGQREATEGAPLHCAAPGATDLLTELHLLAHPHKERLALPRPQRRVKHPLAEALEGLRGAEVRGCVEEGPVRLARVEVAEVSADLQAGLLCLVG